MSASLPLRIFLASPSDVDAERLVVKACVDEHNHRHSKTGDVQFEVVEWNQTRGTAQRPQSAINELISESHYMLVLFKERWGSEPGSPWGYTSGTEEELFTGLLDLGQTDRPMRDVWVAFLNGQNPDEHVTDLKGQMIERNAMMFEEIGDTRDLKEKLAERLEGWAFSAAYKQSRQINLMPSSGREVLKAANLRLRGEKLVELGQPDVGAQALSEAAILGGPDEQLSYARFLARQGTLDEALTAAQHAIDFFTTTNSPLESTHAAEAFAAFAGILRKQGRDVDAIGRLEQALTLVAGDSAYSIRIRCRILDELGLARQKAGDTPNARKDFEAAAALRRSNGRPQELAQSLINLARAEVQDSDLSAAKSHVAEVLDLLRGVPANALHANAETLAAQVLLRSGSPSDAIEHAARALSINRQIANRNGEAIALLLLAQCHRAADMVPEAVQYASKCLELNELMGSESGAKRARWLLDQLARTS